MSDIKTPLGSIDKKTAYIIGGGIVVVAGIVYYRQKKAAATSNIPADNSSNEIDPATGFPYGTTEDAQALAAQNNYATVGGGSSGGGASSMPPSNLSFSNNGQWTQAAIQTMEADGSATDPSALSAALGKYISGQYIAVGSAEDSLVTQAIAHVGMPPVAGPNGYPPNFNRTPLSTTVGQVGGLHAIRVSSNEIALAWNAVNNANGYDLSWRDGHGRTASATSLGNNYVMSNLPRSERYTVQVRAKASNNGTPGPWSAAFTTTTSK